MIKKYWYCKKCKVKITPDFEQEFNLVCQKCSTALDLIYDGKILWSDFSSDINGVLRYAEIIPVSRGAGTPFFRQFVHSFCPQLVDGILTVAS